MKVKQKERTHTMTNETENKDKYVGILTTYVDDSLTRDDYEEFCEINDITPGDDDDFEEWKREEADRTWDDDMDNLEYIMANDRFLITGHVGAWDGRHEIRPMKATGLLNAIKRCRSNDYLDIEVKLNTETGIVEYYGHHHDGTNCFEICKLSDKGCKGYEKWVETGERWEGCPDDWFEKIYRKEIWG